jgi:acyl-CoA synthetase (NDP forming)
MSDRFKQYQPAFIVQEFLSAGKEVIMGAKGNDGLPPTMMFGLGGIFVEVLKDVQFRLAPLAKSDADDMIRSIKGAAILEGTRGDQPVDFDKLSDILVRLAQLGTDFPDIDEMDLNPVFAFEAGKGAVVVDARLKMRGSN